MAMSATICLKDKQYGKIPVQPPDPEELKAERHVTEIMGPPQGFDGNNKPTPEQNVEAEQKLLKSQQRNLIPHQGQRM